MINLKVKLYTTNSFTGIGLFRLAHINPKFFHFDFSFVNIGNRLVKRPLFS